MQRTCLLHVRFFVGFGLKFTMHPWNGQDREEERTATLVNKVQGIWRSAVQPVLGPAFCHGVWSSTAGSGLSRPSPWQTVILEMGWWW